MRIIGGTLSGRRFGAPSGRGTRPTADRVREAVASALDARGAFDDARVLDLFAGTGALSFEALSRGASTAVVVDHDPTVIRQLRKSAEELGLTRRVQVVRANLLSRPPDAVRRIPEAAESFTLIFADAPYSRTDGVPGLLSELVRSGRLEPGAWVVVEHSAAHGWIWPIGLASDAEYRYGQTRISLGFYAPERGSL